MNNRTAFVLVTASLVALTGCKSESYMSSISLTGADSRDDLATSVRKTVEAQKGCFEEFVAAHTLLIALQQADEEHVDQTFATLRTQVDTCARTMEAFGEHILTVENSAMTLFSGWEIELDEFRSEIMREHSAERLKSAQSGFALLQDELTSVHGQMTTLLDSHRDYVLYFNHNLNGASLDVLDQENERFDSNMEALALECRLVEDDAETFTMRLKGAPNVSPVSEMPQE